MGSIASERRFKADTVAVIGAGPSGLAAAKYAALQYIYGGRPMLINPDT